MCIRDSNDGHGPMEYGGGRTPSDHDRHWLESPTGDLRDPTGRRPSQPDWRPSRPAVSPSYAQGSWYGTNRVVASAPGRLAGPAAPLLSTTRAAQPPGTRPQPLGVLRSTNCARISEEPDAGTTPHACDPAWLPTQGAGPPGRVASTRVVAPRLVCERG